MRTDPGSQQERVVLWTRDAVTLWLSVCILLGAATFLFSRGIALLTQDFRAFYSAGEIARQSPSLLFDLGTQGSAQRAFVGPGPLLPFYHPAYEALLYLPLSLLGYRAAYFVYMGWNVLLLWACYLFAPLGTSRFIRRFPRPVLFFLSFPLLLCVFVGQNSLLFLLALCFIFKCIEQRRNRLAGAILGLALFKLPIVVPLALLLSIRKEGRFFQGFVLSAAAVVLLSTALIGLSGSREFLHLLSNASLAANHSEDAQRQAAAWLRAMPNLSGLLYICGVRYLTAKAALAVNAGASLLLLGAGVYLVLRASRESTAFCVAILCAILVSPHLYIYDYAALLLPLILLTHRWMPVVAAIWFIELPLLYAIGFLTWFSPAVVIPILLLCICIAEIATQRQAKGVNSAGLQSETA